ncbi:glycoside hydrolase family 28 protein [Sphingobacterium sp. JB170]|uniref:rhamnogalacturonidase n=1 Tax=Sphingobacterium sp. JB170 TaxID=1434842 RepID=UPI00097E8498|nr:glycosyl hydrolase family 28 protein [Sphingobacterium sp. JB170]SJN34439.1 Exopolygalacturonase precursor [Sphingobacterium sp. JB170]
MKNKTVLSFIFLVLMTMSALAQGRFPDGTPISDWFTKVQETRIETLGKAYRITDYGVLHDSTSLQTEKIQAVIDKAYENGGGVVVIPMGTYLSGSLFFKPNTHLHLEEGAVLKGSDDISNFALLETRMEGQTVKYFSALVNADNVDGFTVSGSGALDGNGLRYWKAFWLRRSFNPDCTNMDEMRPRILYVSNSKDVQISGIKMRNSPFWTSHYYRCENLKLLDLHISAPEKPVKAPSSDAIDLDVCHNVLIKNCYLSVNDDAIALKGGKGPHADKDPNNGANYNIIIENSVFGFCHSALTCGSESIHSYNIIFRNNTLNKAKKLLQLKMRPDTPQLYEFIVLENVKGNVGSMLFVKPWTQFFDLKGEEGIKKSFAKNITLSNIELDVNILFDVVNSNQYELSNFVFEKMNIQANKPEIHQDYIKNFTINDVTVNNNALKSN